MTWIARLAGKRHDPVVTNVGARVGALVSLAVATVLVARTGGAGAVGVYTLLRVLPWLLGVLMAGGLPGAIPYFLAGSARGDPRLRSTLVAIIATGGLAGAALWAAGSPVLARVFFRNLDPGLVAWAGLAVLTQLFVVSGKACLQGSGDLSGANRVFVLQELTFLPGYVALQLAGLDGNVSVVAGLILADVATSLYTWPRLARGGYFAAMARPSMALARRVYSYGMRAQLGVILNLLNLRLDFALLGALAGPAVLGTYAVASKFAELLRLVPQSLTYVLYPRYAREGRSTAARKARKLIPAAGILTVAGAVPLALAAGVILPLVYGHTFAPSVLPARIIIVGLAAEGVAGVITAFLYGAGRPGLNSLGLAVGLGLTVLLDLLLIPRLGAVGAALASAAAYLSTTAVLAVIFWRLTRSSETGSAPIEPLEATDGDRRSLSEPLPALEVKP